MSFSRTYDSQQALATLASLPGTVVIRQTPQGALLGAGFGMACIVGEPTDDQGSDPNKTLVNTVRELTSADQLANDYGGISSQIGTAANGWEGNIAKALALPGIEFSRLCLCAPQLSAGQVTFARPNPGRATLTPTEAPWRFSAGNTLVLSVDGGPTGTATFDAARAAVTGSGLAISDLNGKTLIVSIDGGPEQTITLTVACIDIASTVIVINGQIEGAVASSASGQLRITSDRYGTGSGVEIVDGTALVELGLSVSSAAGTGDVSDIRAVTAAEWAAVVEADIAGVSVDPATGAISSDTDGAGGSLTVDGSSSAAVRSETGLATGTTAVGGTATAEEAVIPAGTRVSNGSTRIYLTLEKLTFPAGTSGTSLTQSVRVRPQTSSTILIGLGACTTIVDTLDDATFTVNNAAQLTPPDFDAAYATAIAATLGESGIPGLIDVIIARRHTAAVHVALRANATTAATGKRPRVAILGNPIGTSNATAIGSSGVGVGTSRSRYWGHAYPNFRTRLADDIATQIDMHADVAAAALCSTMLPEQNIGENRDALVYVQGLESGLDVTPSKAQYSAWLNTYGLLTLQLQDGKAEFLSDPTTDVGNDPWDELNHVRMVNFLTVSLHEIGARWAKKLRSNANKEGLRLDLDGFLATLKSENNPSLQRINDYSIDETTGNTTTTIAAGLHVVKVAVQTLGLMNTIVFQLLAGKTVRVTAEAVATQ